MDSGIHPAVQGRGLLGEVHWRVINIVVETLRADEMCQKESVRITARYRDGS